jgi:hypothetical protein
MSYDRKAIILDIEEKRITTIGISLIFIIITTALIGFATSNSAIEQNQARYIVLITLAIIFITLLSIYANYKTLLILKDHAEKIILLSYIIFFSTIVAFLSLSSLFLLILGNQLGFIFLAIAIIIIFALAYYWTKFRRKIKLAAKWISVATSIVVKEPGMIVLSLFQYLTYVLAAIAFITSLSLFSASAVSLGDILLVLFLYFWLTLSVIYYFDAANTYVSYARLKGVDPKIAQGLNAANKKIGSLLLFAFLSSIVMTIVYTLRCLASLSEADGDNIFVVIFVRTIGLFFALLSVIAEFLYHYVSFFVIPLIVIEDKNTLEAVSKSSRLFSNNAWNVIITDMGFSIGTIIIYVITGLITGILGFFYGIVISSSIDGQNLFLFNSISNVIHTNHMISMGIYSGLVTLTFGIFVAVFFLRPLYIALKTTIFIHANEGEETLLDVSEDLKNQIQKSLNPQKLESSKTESDFGYNPEDFLTRRSVGAGYSKFCKKCGNGAAGYQGLCFKFGESL